MQCLSWKNRSRSEWKKGRNLENKILSIGILRQSITLEYPKNHATYSLIWSRTPSRTLKKGVYLNNGMWTHPHPRKLYGKKSLKNIHPSRRLMLPLWRCVRAEGQPALVELRTGHPRPKHTTRCARSAREARSPRSSIPHASDLYYSVIPWLGSLVGAARSGRGRNLSLRATNQRPR
jgi:hypothetical protein